MKPSATIISAPVSTVQTVPEVQQLAGLANACGSQGVVQGEDVRYTVYNHLLPAALVASIEALAPYGVVMTGYDAAVYGTHERHVRYMAVADLAADLPAEIPGSLVVNEDESTRQMTWQEVQDLPTVSVDPVAGNYYFNVTAHLGHRRLSNIELAAMSGLSLLTEADVAAVYEANPAPEA